MPMLDGGGWGVGAFQIVSSIIPVRFGMLGVFVFEMYRKFKTILFGFEDFLKLVGGF
jgi:hypothetical protein